MCAACETATETERAGQKGMYLVTRLFFSCASSDLDLPFLSPPSSATFWLGPFRGVFFMHRERGKEERMNERTRSHRASLPPLPFSSTLIIIDRRISPSTDEEPTTPSISKNNFLLSSFFFDKIVRSID
jgi:hypothetical protein